MTKSNSISARLFCFRLTSCNFVENRLVCSSMSSRVLSNFRSANFTCWFSRRALLTVGATWKRHFLKVFYDERLINFVPGRQTQRWTQRLLYWPFWSYLFSASRGLRLHVSLEVYFRCQNLLAEPLLALLNSSREPRFLLEPK